MRKYKSIFNITNTPLIDALNELWFTLQRPIFFETKYIIIDCKHKTLLYTDHKQAGICVYDYGSIDVLINNINKKTKDIVHHILTNAEYINIFNEMKNTNMPFKNRKWDFNNVYLDTLRYSNSY